MRTLLILALALTLPLFGAHTSLRLNGAQQAHNTTIPNIAQNAAVRMEGQLTFTHNPASANISIADFAHGLTTQWTMSDVISIFPVNITGGSCTCNIQVSGATSFTIKIRYDRKPSGAGGSYIVGAWDGITGILIGSYTGTYTGTTAYTTPGAYVGSTTGQDTAWGWLKFYSTNLTSPLAQPPLLSSTGDLLDINFNNSLSDTSGRGYDFSGVTPNTCGSAPCWVTTLGLPFTKAVIYPNLTANIKPYQTAHPDEAVESWDTSTNHVNHLDGSNSYSDAGGTPTCAWQSNAGPTTPTFSDPSSCTPLVTNLAFGDYSIQLTVTASDLSTNIATMHVGAVQMDANGVVVPSNANTTNLLGPMIALGQNGWSLVDERELSALDLRTAAYAVADPYNSGTLGNPTWDIPQTGTVSYTYNGTGNSVGASGTTLNGACSNTATSCVFSGETGLDFSTVPTRVMIQLSSASLAFEEIRVCSYNTGTHTATFCYDGRGVDDASGMGSVLGPTSWLSGAVVGQQQIIGSGTSFTSTICPGGAPGPAGPVTYSTGTVGLTTGSTTMTGSGTTWDTSVDMNANSIWKGLAVRVSGVTHSGSGFTYNAFITTVNTTTNITLSRVFPADADTASGLSYKIILPWYRQIVPAVTRPSPYFGDALVNFGSTGCESDTLSFINVGYGGHDSIGLNGTSYSGRTYSFLDTTGAYNNQTSSGGVNFYGEGLASLSGWLRSGLKKFKDAAEAMNAHWIRYPSLVGLSWSGSPLFGGGGIISSTAGYVLDGVPALNDIMPFWNDNIYASQCNDWDPRDGGYKATHLIQGTRYYPNNDSFRTLLQGHFQTLNTLENSCAHSGATGVEQNSNAIGIINGSPIANVTLTNGSAIGTGSGFPTTVPGVGNFCNGVDVVTVTMTAGSASFTVTSGSLTAGINGLVVNGLSYSASRTDSTHGSISVLWPLTSGSYTGMSQTYDFVTGLSYMMTFATDGLDYASLRKNYACHRDSSSQITLDRPFVTVTPHTSPDTYATGISNLVGYGVQPYMKGIQAYGFSQGAALDAALSTSFGTKASNAGLWIKTYGVSPDNGGLQYGRVFGFCESSGTPSGSFDWAVPGCIYGVNTPITVAARELLSEGMTALISWFLSDPTPTNRTTLDTLYGNLYCADGYNAAWISTCDSLSVGNNLPLSNLTDIYLGAGKYYGFFFGMGMAHQWPAVRCTNAPKNTAGCPGSTNTQNTSKGAGVKQAAGVLSY